MSHKCGPFGADARKRVKPREKVNGAQAAALAERFWPCALRGKPIRDIILDGTSPCRIAE